MQPHNRIAAKPLYYDPISGRLAVMLSMTDTTAEQASDTPTVKQLARPHLMPVLFLLVAAFALYGKALGHDFLVNWDDGLYVSGNPDIMGFSFEHLRHAFTNYYAGNYAPLHIISYMLDYTLWGLNPAGYKLLNILFHALNTLLYYTLLVRITGRRLLALAAATLFLCHPVQVESVVWISQRKNLLAMFFFLISFLAYLSWKERRSYGNYILSLAAFTLALLSKSVVVVLPLILICHGLCFRERETLWRLVRDKLPYLALAIACATVALYSQQGGDGGRVGHLGGNPLITMLNMLPVFSRYLILLLFPAQLSVIYNGSIRTAPDSEVVLSALLLIIFMAAWVHLYRRNRGLFFWGSLFIIGLLPVSNIIPIVTLMNDRYLYFPMLGFAAFIAHLPTLESGGTLSLRYLVSQRVLFLTVMLALSALTWNRIDVWNDSVALWGNTLVTAQEGSWYAYNPNFVCGAYADALSRRGNQAQKEMKFFDARSYYLKALAYDPTSPMALYNLGWISILQRKPLAGRPYLIRYTEIYRHNDDGYANLGLNYALTGELDQAEKNLRRALEINPENNLGLISLEEVRKMRGALKNTH